MAAWNLVLSLRRRARTIPMLSHRSASAVPAHVTHNKFSSTGINPVPKSSPCIAKGSRRQRTDDGTVQERQGDFLSWHGTKACSYKMTQGERKVPFPITFHTSLRLAVRRIERGYINKLPLVSGGFQYHHLRDLHFDVPHRHHSHRSTQRKYRRHVR